jgi:plastocyanin
VKAKYIIFALLGLIFLLFHSLYADGQTAFSISNLKTTVTKSTVNVSADIPGVDHVTIDWGDGTNTQNGLKEYIHTYSQPGTYVIKLTAYNAGGSSTFAETTAVISLKPMMIPSINATITGHTVDISATVDPSEGATTNRVTIDWGDGTNTQNGLKEYIHTYSQPGTYVITVTGYDTNGFSVSAETNAVILSPGEKPNMPNILSSPQDLTSYNQGNSIMLNWKSPQEGTNTITQYLVYRAETPDNFVAYQTVSSDTLNFTDANIFAGNTYYYEVIAVNNVGKSSPSNIVTVVASVGAPQKVPWYQDPSSPDIWVIIVGAVGSAAGLGALFMRTKMNQK